jgi:hypothetical protein
VSEGSATYRISILVFDTPSRLWGAMADLLDNGLSSDQFCLVGRPSTLEALKAPNELARSVGDKFSGQGSAQDTPIHMDGEGGLVARRGSPTLALFSRSAFASSCFDWMQEELSKKLVVHAEGGAIILMVSAFTAQQHALTGRILLRHGRHDLQTHEFTRPMPAS